MPPKPNPISKAAPFQAPLGFTLIEVLVTLLVIAIATAAVLISYRLGASEKQTPQYQELLRLQTFLNRSRDLAVSRHESLYLHYLPKKGLWVSQFSPLQEGADKRVSVLSAYPEDFTPAGPIFQPGKGFAIELVPSSPIYWFKAIPTGANTELVLPFSTVEKDGFFDPPGKIKLIWQDPDSLIYRESSLSYNTDATIDSTAS